MLRASTAVFPQYYSSGAWLPATAFAAGFIALEFLVHARHAALRAATWPDGDGAMIPLWEAAYKAGHAITLAPLLLSGVRARAGAVRRILAGFAILLIAGSALAVLPGLWRHIDLAPCLLVANSAFVLSSLLRYRMWSPAVAALLAVILAAVATLFTGRHVMADILYGGVLGYGASVLVFWKELRFLELPNPWESIDYELRDLWNLLVRNSRRNWEVTYASGRWEFLDSRSQKPRHYVIAGAIADRFPKRDARVLDVGCGYGTLYPLMRERIGAYIGLDLSEEALQKCRQTFKDDDRCRFVRSAFEEYAPAEKYDVVVLNEVLYYFPFRRAEDVFRKAASLAAPGGVVIVSMNRNQKAFIMWKLLARIARPRQSLRATNLETGSYWTVNLYSASEVVS